MTSRPPVFVHLLPTLIPPGTLKGGVAVVIDVLRATTTMVHALAAGCDAIVPCTEIDEARKAAAALPAGSAVLAGERHGLPIEGFDLGNSPGDCTSEVCSGKTLVMTTTNGTRAILASLEAERVLVAAFVNRVATVEALKTIGLPIHLVCAGTDGQVSLEDSMFAGALAHDLDSWAWEEVEARGLASPEDLETTILSNDQAEIAAALWRDTEAGLDEGYLLEDALADGRGGRRVLELGLGDDLEDAATVDRFAFAAELLRDPLRIVPLEGAAGPRLRIFT
jgi:2-phosphosulfolactate phosphatase